MTGNGAKSDEALLQRPFSEVMGELHRWFEERGLAQEMGLGKQPALVVVDMQAGFTDPDFPLGSESSDTLATINRVIAGARERQLPIVHTVSTFTPVANVWSTKMPSQRQMVPGSEFAELDSRLDVKPEDRVIEKHFASAFFGTDLDEYLRSRGVDSLIVTGVTTSGCIRATVVDGVSHGFRPVVPQEAVADRSVPVHTMSLFDIQAKYGDVVPTDALLDELAGG